jgi:hypothetical protein
MVFVAAPTPLSFLRRLPLHSSRSSWLRRYRRSQISEGVHRPGYTSWATWLDFLTRWGLIWFFWWAMTGGPWLLGIFALLDLTEWRLWSTLASRSCPGIRKEILCSGLEHCLETITISSGFRFFSSLFFFVIGKYCVSNINVHETVITILFILYFVSVLLADFI